jgi:hypothetical protein
VVALYARWQAHLKKVDEQQTHAQEFAASAEFRFCRSFGHQKHDGENSLLH